MRRSQLLSPMRECGGTRPLLIDRLMIGANEASDRLAACHTARAPTDVPTEDVTEGATSIG